MPTSRSCITGLVLAGGRGSRMGGQDKGLVMWGGEPLALHALRRLGPQVGAVAVSANRNLPVYSAMAAPMGAAVWTDEPSDEAYAGPLAGFLSGLAHCPTDYLATVPCDTPGFPPDLVARLAAALVETGAPLASVVTPGVGGRMDRQPVFCLMHRSLRAGLAAFFASGGRRVGEWTAQVGATEVRFDDVAGFHNANTLEDLARLAGGV